MSGNPTITRSYNAGSAADRLRGGVPARVAVAGEARSSTDSAKAPCPSSARRTNVAGQETVVSYASTRNGGRSAGSLTSWTLSPGV